MMSLFKEKKLKHFGKQKSKILDCIYIEKTKFISVIIRKTLINFLIGNKK